MVEQVQERVQIPLLGQALCDLRQHRWRQARLAEVGGEPIVLSGVVVAPACPARQRLVQRGGRPADRAEDRRRQELGLPERVLNALARSGVLEMAGIADEDPPRPRRLAEEPFPAQRPEELAGPPCVRQHVSHRGAAPDVLQVAFLQAAPEPRQLAQLRQREHLIEPAVRWYRDHEVA